MSAAQRHDKASDLPTSPAGGQSPPPPHIRAVEGVITRRTRAGDPDGTCDCYRCSDPHRLGGSHTVRRIVAACLLSALSLLGSVSLDLGGSLEEWRETERARQALTSCPTSLLVHFISRLQADRSALWRTNSTNISSNSPSGDLSLTAQALGRLSALCAELRHSGGYSCPEEGFTCEAFVNETLALLTPNPWPEASSGGGDVHTVLNSIIAHLLDVLGDPEKDLAKVRAHQDWADVMSLKLTLRAKEVMLRVYRSQVSSKPEDHQREVWQQIMASLDFAAFMSDNAQSCWESEAKADAETVPLYRPAIRFPFPTADGGHTARAYVQELGSVQGCLLQKGNDSLRQKSRDILSAVSLKVSLLGIACLIYPIVLVSFRQMTHWIQNYARSLRERTDDLKRERRVAEDLLHQMLPKSVARQLRKRKQVEAESYEQVTIFFSDIVGFTTIAASCAPLQVVEMLNNLYMCFDTRIESYDVYKVETIGDAYMVVSGLPERNGNRHADEIAKMALDLVAAVRQVPIPHMPHDRLQLRAGVHTGPCVAGVVGYKMPRYCLFGDTVNTASRMESTSLPQKIHISSVTFCALVKDDAYDIEPRGETEVKGKGKMKTYWLIGNKNYSVQNDSLVCHWIPRPRKVNENGDSISSVQQSGASSIIQTPSNRTTPLSIMESSANGQPGGRGDFAQKADSQPALSTSLHSSEFSRNDSPSSGNGNPPGGSYAERGFTGEPTLEPTGSSLPRANPTGSKPEGVQREKSQSLPGFVDCD